MPKGVSMKNSIMLDHVLRESNGALLVPLKVTAKILGLEPQTIRNNKNNIAGLRSSLTGVKFGARVFFNALDIAEYIGNQGSEEAPQKLEKRGRPRKSAMSHLASSHKSAA